MLIHRKTICHAGNKIGNHFRPRRAYRFCLEDSIYLADAALAHVNG